MRCRTRRKPALLAVALGAASLAGCGSSTKTVSAGAGTSAQVPAGTPSQTASIPQTTSTTPAGGTPGASASGGTQAPTTTRSAPEPAFTQGQTQAPGLSGAQAAVRARGFTPLDTSQYHANQTLRVLVARRTGSGDGYGQQAFFFVNGHYIGTDSSQTSATLKVLSQGDTEVVLAYPLYHGGDPLCCPGGGTARVRFVLDNGRLAALDAIPPVSSAKGLGRN